MTFHCTYCVGEHPDEMRAAEHIVPQFIGNRSFTHRAACRRMNQGLAHAVEAIFHRDSAVNTILALLTASGSAQPRFLWKSKEKTNSEQFVFVQQGNIVHGSAPRSTSFSMVRIPMLRRDGSQVLCPVQLPFELTDNITGSELLLPKRAVEKRMESNLSQLTDYLERLFSDPSIDPVFAQFIDENDIVPSELYISLRLAEGPREAGGHTQQITHQHLVDETVAARYFIKIALLFAAESGAGALLMTPQAEALRSYLCEFFVDPAIACDSDGSCLPFFSHASVADNTAYWWTHPIDITEVAINTAGSLSPRQRETLIEHNELRALQLRAIRHLIRFERLGSLPEDDICRELRNSAYHELILRSDAGGPEDLISCCDILLFGGAFQVTVQLGMGPTMRVSQAYKRIDTPWYRSPTREP